MVVKIAATLKIPARANGSHAGSGAITVNSPNTESVPPHKKSPAYAETGKSAKASSGIVSVNEKTARASGVYIPDGVSLMKEFLGEKRRESLV